MMTSAKRSTALLLLLLCIGFLIQTPSLQADDEEDAKDDFLSKATKKAIDSVRHSVVNVRPVYDESKFPSYNEYVNKLGGRMKRVFQRIEGQLTADDKEALRYLFHRLDSEREMQLFNRKIQQVRRSDDFIDFLQYMAPPLNGFSGVLLEDGYVLTSKFAVNGDYIKKIEIHTAGNHILTAKKLGSTAPLDLALLKLNEEVPEEASFINLKSPEHEVRTGFWAIAVGRSPQTESVTASRGIISAKKRRQGRIFQSDVLCNYTNTGGALINIQGEFIGLVSGITLATALRVGQNSGVTMAVKPDAIQEVLPDLKKGKQIGRPFLGVSPGKTTDEGVRIQQVIEGYAAEKSGMKDGDVITKFDGQPITEWRDLVNAIRNLSPGDKVTFTILRDGETKKLDATLTERD